LPSYVELFTNAQARRAVRAGEVEGIHGVGSTAVSLLVRRRLERERGQVAGTGLINTRDQRSLFLFIDD